MSAKRIQRSSEGDALSRPGTRRAIASTGRMAACIRSGTREASACMSGAERSIATQAAANVYVKRAPSCPSLGVPRTWAA